MTRRAYIDCPLSAALAAKNHGFKFVNKGGDELVLVQEMSGRHVFQKWTDAYFSGKPYRQLIDFCGDYYIDGESLPLLEPMVGDLLHGYHDNPKLYNPSFFILPEDFNIKCYGWEFKIIQRNNHPFPTIQYEDAQ